MSTFEKIGMGIVGVAMVATLVLPGRQTASVLTSFFNGISEWTGTAMGTQNGG